MAGLQGRPGGTDGVRMNFPGHLLSQYDLGVSIPGWTKEVFLKWWLLSLTTPTESQASGKGLSNIFWGSSQLLELSTIIWEPTEQAGNLRSEKLFGRFEP